MDTYVDASTHVRSTRMYGWFSEGRAIPYLAGSRGNVCEQYSHKRVDYYYGVNAHEQLYILASPYTHCSGVSLMQMMS